MAKKDFDLSQVLNADLQNIHNVADDTAIFTNTKNKCGRKKGEDGIKVTFFIRERLFDDFDALAKLAGKSRTQYLNDLIEKDITNKKEMLATIKKLQDQVD